MNSTVQFGIVCFVLFFLISQVFQWAQEITLPLPFFILSGALLAIASNFDRRAGFPFNLINSPTEAPPVEPPTIAQSTTAKFPREISFTIRKPEKLDQ
ncbi:hypothetical protein [Leptolyngbya sp. NIES-2104]|uniref:hypothetical protein n=1 Tax=Leptolyngbya sp. NIES-2104 TaxID=1552121 RepID=UPI0006EC4560|nr:hypothetical protein [Leptolyngbya sp. NIES-2104]GAP95427.1 hypothetical protein NIES2104_19490 [Leptolyngbya sp. NIES-2104]